MSASYPFTHDGLHDVLTHLYAPPYMYEQLRKRLAATARSGLPVHLLRLRMQARASEDEIVMCAEGIGQLARVDDVIGRMGYYEFLIIVNGGAESVEKLEDRIRGLPERGHHLTIATISSNTGEEVEELLQRLDHL